MSVSPLNTANSLPALQAMAERQQQEKPSPVAAPTASANRQLEPTRDELLAPMQQVNAALGNYGVEFEISDESAKVIVRLVDKENGNVIRQIPSEEVLRLADRLEELQGVGALVSEQA